MNPLVDIGLTHYLVLSAILFSAGIATVIMRRNAVIVLMGLELILNAASINFIAFARFHPDKLGLESHVIVIFVITLAAAEAAVALAIILNVYNRFGTITVDEVGQLKE